jgi:hypothetical protein
MPWAAPQSRATGTRGSRTDPTRTHKASQELSRHSPQFGIASRAARLRHSNDNGNGNDNNMLEASRTTDGSLHTNILAWSGRVCTSVQSMRGGMRCMQPVAPRFAGKGPQRCVQRCLFCAVPATDGCREHASRLLEEACTRTICTADTC